MVTKHNPKLLQAKCVKFQADSEKPVGGDDYTNLP